MDSAPPPDWLTSVSRPFDDNPELQLAARQELAERTADADPGALSSLGRRFDAIDQVPPKKRILLSWFPIALATLLTLGIGLPTILYYRGVSQFMQGPVSGGYDSMAEAAFGLSPEDRLFIFGDQTQPTSELARKALWETQPKIRPSTPTTFPIATHSLPIFWKPPGGSIPTTAGSSSSPLESSARKRWRRLNARNLPVRGSVPSPDHGRSRTRRSFGRLST